MSPKSKSRRLLLCTIPNRGPTEGFLWQRAYERVAAQLVAQVQAEYRTVKAILEEERARFEG